MAQTGKTMTFSPPSGQNYSGNEGEVVYISGAGEVTVSTNPGTQFPIGIITKAVNATDGKVTVCIGGYCQARAGATITAGTHNLLMAGNDSRLDPASTGNFAVARFVGSASAQDGQWIDVYVEPHFYAAS